MFCNGVKILYKDLQAKLVSDGSASSFFQLEREVRKAGLPTLTVNVLYSN